MPSSSSRLSGTSLRDGTNGARIPMVASAAADMLQSGTTGLRFSPNDGSEHLLQCGSLTRNQTLCKFLESPAGAGTDILVLLYASL